MSDADTSRSIVVIDDDPRMLDLIGTVLTGAGYRVVCASDPEQGVGTARREKPAMVIIDILMPGMDGYAVHTTLSNDPQMARSTFLFLSGQGAFTERLRAVGEHGVDFMSKPFTPAILLRKVEKLLARHPAPRVIEPTDPTRASVPVRMGKEATLSSSDLATLPTELRRVLVVDDCLEYRDFIRHLLATNGFTVFEAQNAEEALKQAADQRPWLALVDVNLPGIDGFELCRLFRAQSVLRHVPVIFLSARDDFADRRKGYEVGGDDYLPKTARPRELLMRICLSLGRLTESVGWTRRNVSMQGEMALIGPAGLLQMFHLSRVSGSCRVRQGGAEVEVRFREGEVIGAAAGEARGPEAVFAFLAWTAGQFEFRPGDPGNGEPFEQTFSELLLEGCQRLDESRRTT